MPASPDNPLPQRRSIRLPEYDYTQPGAYFITLVTSNRISRFGEIINAEMHLTRLGLTVDREWRHLSCRFPGWNFDAFVVMPNHVHGLLLLEGAVPGPAQQGGPTTTPESVTLRPNIKKDAVVPGSVGTIVRAFKSSTSLRYNRMTGLEPGPLWQRNYHEHVVRSNAELNMIYSYIENNPAQWAEDRENPALNSQYGAAER